jgi:hypothetical protein
MPLQIAQSIPLEPPAAKIFFHGQLLWYPDTDPNNGGKSLRIGVLRCAANHYLTIELRIKKAGQPDLTIMRYLGPMRFRLPNVNEPGLLIDVVDLAGQTIPDNHVSKYIPDPDFVRLPDSPSDPQDYRWGVDLDDIHKVEEQQHEILKLDPHCTDPSIKVTSGILYTALKSDDDVVITKVSLKTKKEVDFYPIAAVMGINIYLADGQLLDLKWLREDGLLQELKLDKPDKDTSYEIYIDNNPTYTNTDTDIDARTHTDFTEFYKAFKLESLPDEKFDLRLHPDLQAEHKTKFVQHGVKLGTPTIPCMPGGSGGS